MATQRKNETKEEYLQRMRIDSKKRRDKRTPEQVAYENNQSRLRSIKRRHNWTAEDRRLASDKERERRNKYIVVYKHTLEGKTYFGSGNLVRPVDFLRRSSNWYEAFNTIPDIEVLVELKTKSLALVLEQFLINIYGMSNLVNKHKACSIKDSLQEYLNVKQNSIS